MTVIADDDIFGPGGRIAQRLPHFEQRPQQAQMARAVNEAFDKNHHLLVEAGTGVGKSFAYLVPAIRRTTNGGGRVVISTHTIALQEQLMQKDIPFLRSVFPEEFSAVLVKGRSNYVGLRRLARTSKRQEMLLGSRADVDELWAIEDWAYKTTDGTLSDLTQAPSPQVWDKVKSESDDCMGRRCPSFQACFYQRARRRAAGAHLLVVNHAILLADVAIRLQGASLLPDYEHLIIDEAHTLEAVAAEHLGISLSDSQLRYLLNTLHNERTGRGVLALGKGASVIPCVEAVQQEVREYFDELVAWFRGGGSPTGRVRKPPPIAQPITDAMSELADRLREVREQVVDEDDRLELETLADRCRTLGGSVQAWHEQEHGDWVYWMESSEQGRQRTSLRASPIQIGEALKESLFTTVKSAVLTSATLTTGKPNDFNYMKSRLGLDAAECLWLGSPFDYQKQAQVYIESGLPDPENKDAFVDAACTAMLKYLEMTGGRAFVLFTSYDLLRRCAARVGPRLTALDMPLWQQGTGMPRSLLLEKFRSTPRSVLFGTDTFWTGVDVPGDALGNVIVVKLPFGVPNHPLIEARIEQIRNEGGNPFGDFQLPEAILKFRQGIGRLIRTTTDVGVIVILDPRICRRGYGKNFLAALPPCPVHIQP